MSPEQRMRVAFTLFIAYLVALIGWASAKPQPKEVVLNVAAPVKPEQEKLHIRGQFQDLAQLLGDKSKPINSVEDLNQVVAVSYSFWNHKNKWAKKIFRKINGHKSPHDAIHMMGKLRESIWKCNFEGYSHLIQAYDAALGPEDLYLEAKDQVKSAVIAAISLHGKNCRDTYYKTFKDVYTNDMHEYLLGLIDFLFDERFLKEIYPDDHPLAIVGFSKTALAVVKYIDRLLDKLTILAERTDYRQHLMSSRSIENVHSAEDLVPNEFSSKIVKHFLMEPCQEFTEQLVDIFYPAMIDLALDDEKISEIDYKNDKRFMDIWRKFIICSAIQQNSGDIDKALRMSIFSKTHLN